MMLPSSQSEFCHEIAAFQRLLASLMRRSRMNQTAFARSLHIHRSTLVRWLSGTTLPSLRQRKQLAALKARLDKTQSPEDVARLDTGQPPVVESAKVEKVESNG